jgi:H+-translocating NAD(P) transhydrogenase subunit alpha
MYARTVTTYLLHLLKDGKIQLDLADELTRGPMVAHRGEVVHDVVKQAMAPVRTGGQTP